MSDTQFNNIQYLIKRGIDENATLNAGGLGLPDGLNRGHFARPTIFADVTPANSKKKVGRQSQRASDKADRSIVDLDPLLRTGVQVADQPMGPRKAELCG